MDNDHGKQLESELTGKLARLLQPDYIFANPKIRFGEGKEEELADAIIPAFETLLTFQFKSKNQEKDPDSLQQVDYGRILKKIKDAIGQAKTTVRAHKQGLLKEFLNLRKIPVPLEGNFSQIVSIIILRLNGEERHAFYERTRFIIPYVQEDGIQHHIFMHDDFDIIIKWQDTVPDLLQYLKMRHSLLHEMRMQYPFFELDLLSCLLFSYPKVKEVLSSGATTLILETGKYQKELRESGELLDQKEVEYGMHAYFIDYLIGWIHTILDPRALKPKSDEFTSNGAYPALIQFYGAITRLERYRIGKKFSEKCVKSITSKRGFNFFLHPLNSNKNWGYLFVATKIKSLEERFDILKGLAFSAFFQTEFKKIIAVITDNEESKNRSFQFLIYEGIKDQKETEWQLKNMPLFKTIEEGESDVWQDMRNNTKKK